MRPESAIPSPSSIARLQEITARLSLLVDVDSLAAELEQVIVGIVDAQYIGLYLYDPEKLEFRLPWARGFSIAERAEAERTAMHRHPGRVIRERKVLNVPDTRVDDRTSSSKRRFTVLSRLWIPIESRGECIGAVGMGSTVTHAFSPEHVALLQYVASLAGIGYRNIADTEALKAAKRRAERA
ncbi:MAG: GAF domain-containing protein, partial [Myxococcota bacterium]